MLSKLKNENQKSLQETEEVLAAAEKLEQENQMLKTKNQQLLHDFDQERQEMRAEMKTLKEENERCLAALIRHSKTRGSHGRQNQNQGHDQ